MKMLKEEGKNRQKQSLNLIAFAIFHKASLSNVRKVICMYRRDLTENSRLWRKRYSRYFMQKKVPQDMGKINP